MLERLVVAARVVEEVRDVVLDGRLEMAIADPAARCQRLLSALERAVDVTRRRGGQRQAGQGRDRGCGIRVINGGLEGGFEMHDRDPRVPGIERNEARHAAR